MLHRFARLAILAIIIFAGVASAEPTGSPTLWEKAAFGEIPGLRYVRLQGWNAAITGTFEVMWGESAAYAPNVVAMSSPYCASSSANDTSAGTGARTIRVNGVNTSFTEFTETVTLNGTTSVNLATSAVLFINSIEVLTAGSGNVNAGIIQCGEGTNTGGDPATPHQYLGVSSATAVPAAGAGFGNVSESFMFAVPAAKTLICKDVQCGSVFATAASGYECAIDGYRNLSPIVKRYFIQMAHNTGSNASLHPGYVVIPEKTLVLGKMAGVTGSNTGPASMHASCLLVDNAWEDTAQDMF